LSLNENWDEDVRADMSDALDRIVPEDKKGGVYRHDAEGSDDMPVCLSSCPLTYEGLCDREILRREMLRLTGYRHILRVPSLVLVLRFQSKMASLQREHGKVSGI